MNKGFFGIIVWTVVCGVGMSLLFLLLTREETYIGNDITFTTNDTRTMNVSTTMTKMEAADDGFFVLRNGTDTLVGKPAPKPLGWEQNAYFVAETEQAPGGLWRIEKGVGVTIHLISESTMTVVIAMNNDARSSLIFLIVSATVVIWFFGLLVATT